MDVKSMSGSSNETYEGRRMVQLRLALDKALDKVYNPNLDKLVAEFDEDLRADHEKRIRSYLKQVNDIISSNVKSEFNVICAEHDLVARLNACDDQEAAQPLMKDGSRLQPLSKIPPEERFRNSIIEQKQQEKKRLQEMIATVNAENERLKGTIETQRSQINSRIEQLKQQKTTISQALSTSETWSQANQ